MKAPSSRVLSVVVSILATIVISGCATPPSKQELASIEYGPAPSNYEATIKAYFEETLFDPYSAQYVFSQPQQFWVKEAPLMGSRLYAGWMVKVGVNAKNRMGGYVGRKYYGIIIKNDRVIKVLEEHELQNLRRM